MRNDYVDLCAGGSATVTVHGRDSFTVVSGVQRRNRAAKDSVWSRVTEKLKQGSGVDTNGAANVKNTDVAEVNGQGGDTKESVTKSAGKQAMRKQRRGFLGWCFPNAAGTSIIRGLHCAVACEGVQRMLIYCCNMYLSMHGMLLNYMLSNAALISSVPTERVAEEPVLREANHVFVQQHPRAFECHSSTIVIRFPSTSSHDLGIVMKHSAPAPTVVGTFVSYYSV